MNKKGFDSNWLGQLKQKCEIVSVLSKYMKVEQKGKNFWACCPFHNEKTPSFSINPQEQFYHCFGCKESGDVINFIMKYESCDFYDAVESLAKSVGMEVPALTDNEEVFKQKKLQERIKNVLELSTQYYIKQLYEKTATVPQQYLINRKVNKKSVQDFKIGYSPDWNGLVNFLKKQGFSVSEMKQAGVVEEKNGNVYDVNAKRLMFPIINPKGETIGFSGRALEKTDFAKYKNTQQTMLFNKSRAVYGIDKVKIKKQQNNLDNVILVEGQVDVITMYQFGFEQTVATLGTALTQEHAQELKRYTDNIVICFDGDTAGEKATLRAIDILKDFNLKIVSLPDKTDPDEFLHSNGAQALENLIKNADDDVEYKIKNRYKQMKNNSNDEKSKFVKDAIFILNELKNSQKYVYLKLISELGNVPLTVLRSDMEKAEIVNKPNEQVQQINNIKLDDGYEKAIKFVFASLVYKKEYASLNFPRYVLLNPIYEKLYDLLMASKNGGEALTISKLYDIFDVKEESIINDIINYNFDIIGNNAKQYYNDCVWTFCEYYLKEKQKILNEQFKDNNFADKRKEILVKIQKVNKQLKNKNLEEDL